jgi:hypothetical protein
VVDAQGRPVRGAAIYVLSAPVAVPDIAAQSADDGSFSIGMPAPGRYRLGARGASGSVEAELTVGAEGAEIELRLAQS